MKDPTTARRHRRAPLATPGSLGEPARHDLCAALNQLLADVWALYLKTKNFHWHMWGPSFPSYHALLDGQSAQLLAMTDVIAERVRKLGGGTLRSIGHIARLQRLADNDAELVQPGGMLAELCEDNRRLTDWLRAVHALCDGHGDVASASLVENWVEEAEQRVWFLFESGRV
ncbi:MAG: DNA starvation/stationary phase protection protein [Burkholderiaceae bacterium]|nr:DNA starvation/stationary phase protection protein [Burkholderiaceae bacterium]